MTTITKSFEFSKAEAKRQVHGIVYVPMVPDSQGDYMTAEEIEKTAHKFNSGNQADKVDLEHNGNPSGAKIVESYIVRDGNAHPRGSWVVGVQVPDNIWKSVTNGELKAFSMAGTGKRIPTTLESRQVNQLQEVEISAISLVKKGANGQTFIAKGQNSMNQNTQKILRVIHERLNAMVEKLEDAEDTAQNAVNLTTGKPQISKSDRYASIQKSELIAKSQRLTSLISKKRDRLENLWGGETIFGDRGAMEQKLVNEIQDLEDERDATTETLSILSDSNRSAFHQRGGSSQKIDAGVGFSDSLFSQRGVSKNAPDIDLSSDLKI